MTDRPFRFGIVAGRALDLPTWTALARRTEELGYDTLLSPDPQSDLDPLTTLSAAAAVTSRLHVGTFVAVDGFRDRGVLAWQARTLHALTGGRFELGLGTGRPDAVAWARGLGRELGPPGERITRLTQTIAEVKAQADRPRLLLAAGGPRMRALAAREADIVTQAWMPRTTEEQARSVVESFREVAGERLNVIELAANLLTVGDDPAPWLERFAGVGVPELIAGGAVTVLPGTPRQGADTLRRRREQLGISYVTINAAFLEQFAPIVEQLRGS
jgi:alkanesulfonate monooxygenase SsuD/methylene tetrahydromethanopterin reductase-like flavin-dependent oxidoreductase (luciferase family)